MKRLIVGVLLVCLVVFGLVGCAKPKAAAPAAGVATLAKYNQIMVGMPYIGVKTFMGSPGKSMGEATVGGVKGSMFQWSGEAAGSYMIIQFKNDQVSEKSQQGLK